MATEGAFSYVPVRQFSPGGQVVNAGRIQQHAPVENSRAVLVRLPGPRSFVHSLA